MVICKVWVCWIVLMVNHVICVDVQLEAIIHHHAFVNDYPIIGIFAQPCNDSHPACGGDCQYIAASYVKYIESAGARVVPVSYNANKSQLEFLFASLNGFLFPGGASNFPESAQYIFDLTVAANDRGEYSPLWGTCLGFEWLLCAAARNASILDAIPGAMNLTLPLRFTAAAAGSRLLAAAGPRLRRILATRAVAFNFHRFGIRAAALRRAPALAAMFAVLTTSDGADGVPFVSTMESRRYPIYGTQWHPEKNAFE
jgi:gamma-glutamyl hydrolase